MNRTYQRQCQCPRRCYQFNLYLQNKTINSVSIIKGERYTVIRQKRVPTKKMSYHFNLNRYFSKNYYQVTLLCRTLLCRTLLCKTLLYRTLLCRSYGIQRTITPDSYQVLITCSLFYKIILIFICR